MPSGRPAITAKRQVTYLVCRADARKHERVTQRGVAVRLAAMMGCGFDEIRDIAAARPIDLGYVVPDVTIASLEAARARRGIIPTTTTLRSVAEASSNCFSSASKQILAAIG
jgi:hypothetical protein